MKSILFFLAALVFPSIALAGSASIVEQLRQEFVGKSFAILVPVAGSTCLQDLKMSYGKASLVDTEVNGLQIRYYTHGNRTSDLQECPSAGVLVPSDVLPGGLYVDGNRMISIHPLRSMMLIKQFDPKSDRIEILLTAVGERGDDAYGKIKLMLGKDYQSKSLEEIEASLSQVIELPRIMDLVQARQAYASIANEIAALEESLSTALAAQQKVTNATMLLTLYEQEPGAATSLNRVAFSPVQAPKNSAKIEKAKQALVGYQQQADKDKIDSSLKWYASATAQMKVDCESLPSTEVATRAELDAHMAANYTSRQDLSKFESARKDVLDIGQSAPQSDEDYSSKCSSSCDILSQMLSKQQETIQAAEATAAEAARQYQEREAQLAQNRLRVQQREEVAKSFSDLKRQKAALSYKLLEGGPGDYAALSAYRGVLQEMIQNRQQAQSQGSRSAAQEIQTLSAQLLKLQQ